MGYREVTLTFSHDDCNWGFSRKVEDAFKERQDALRESEEHFCEVGMAPRARRIHQTDDYLASNGVLIRVKLPDEYAPQPEEEIAPVEAAFFSGMKEGLSAAPVDAFGLTDAEREALGIAEA